MSPTGNAGAEAAKDLSRDDTLDYEILSWHKTFVKNN